MDFKSLLDMVAALSPAVKPVLIALGALVVGGQIYVGLTPTQKDDAWFAKLESIPLLGDLLKAVKAFAPIQRKEPPSQ